MEKIEQVSVGDTPDFYNTSTTNIDIEKSI